MAAAAAAAAVAHERRATLCGHSFQTVAQRSNIVRIFLSSTFLDFVHERNRLFNDAFPELEQWCQEKGVHFQ
uniref:Uncharacterized protein n=1 Tax=Plectus sambesii TaxID=2011161 RepID=A0A914VP66_9BILA